MGSAASCLSKRVMAEWVAGQAAMQGNSLSFVVSCHSENNCLQNTVLILEFFPQKLLKSCVGCFFLVLPGCGYLCYKLYILN
jgi:hypothetical protein